MDEIMRQRIFSIRNSVEFSAAALEVFKLQSRHNPVYSSFVSHLGRQSPSDIDEIPFMPVEFFRTHRVVTGTAESIIVFESSGTTGTVPSKHHVTDPDLYHESFMRTFRMFYGDPGDYLIAALLPSYLERSGSSLVYMVEKLIEASNHSRAGFYKDDHVSLISTFREERNRKKLLIGVSFALLDLAEKNPADLSDVIIMETGGMKGRRKEITRAGLHSALKEKLNAGTIHSEYGMTELLSQAYSKGDGLFRCPPWMRVLVRDTYDPLTVSGRPGATGGICIIDLANINSCSFIATGDLGRLHDDGVFEVLGRFDSSDIRGCNLMVE